MFKDKTGHLIFAVVMSKFVIDTNSELIHKLTHLPLRKRKTFNLKADMALIKDLTNNTIHYYSIMNDSRSATTAD